MGETEHFQCLSEEKKKGETFADMWCIMQ